MNCDAFEEWLLTPHENAPVPEQPREAEAHRLACAPCRALSRQHQLLDRALQERFGPVTLPAHFEQNLRRRLSAQEPAMAPQQRLERRRQLQEEYEQTAARFKCSSLLQGWAETWGITIVLAAGLGLAVGFALPHLSTSATPVVGSLSLSALLIPLLGSLLFCGIGLAAAFYRPLRGA